jgi:hypothetical protein
MVPGGSCLLNSACFWKSIKVSIDVRTPDKRAKNDIGGDGGVGRAVAAVAECYPAVRSPHHSTFQSPPREYLARRKALIT